ncbi:MAG: hypothetical protein EKK47_00495 [Burkholderiales bacterium]|jgi:hypothetical protein|nr:MAG: hypothetical protein EKK47_00495 [Burkholderiales bacterium]
MVIQPPSGGKSSDNAELTTIYGKQAAPGSQITGFDLADGISFDSLEQQFGGSGSGLDYTSLAHESVAALIWQVTSLAWIRAASIPRRPARPLSCSTLTYRCRSLTA